MTPDITINDYDPSMAYLLYPQYREGWFKGLEEGLDIGQFQERLTKCATIGISKMYLASYNLSPVCLYETHRIPGSTYWDTHAIWFTNRRKKRILTSLAYLEKVKDRDMLAVVPEDDSKGHFAMVKRGELVHMGNAENMNVFVNRWN